jgi:lipopolysaccharide/colanic/teichoic acid biosynthesis glycosyltransferase
MLPREMANSLSQIAIGKLNNNFQMWKFRIMNFLMGKGYWEFITDDEKKPHITTNSSQQNLA